jgi:hypothetical protein
MFMLKKMLDAISKNELMPDLLHDDFIFVDDFAMETKEDWLITSQKQIDEGMDFSKLKIGETVETNDMICWEFLRDKDGMDMRVTNVCLIKDGKIWRHIINRCPV